MIKQLVTAIAAAAAFAAVPAFAAETDGTITQISVPYGDLNLASAEGAKMLDTRVKAAARRICGVEQAPGLAETRAVQGCRAEVLGSAQTQVSQALASRGSGSVVVAASR